MALTLGSRFKNAWNVFMNKDPTNDSYRYYGATNTSYRPDRVRFTRGNERSIVTSVYNRIAIDVATIEIKHVRVDDDERYLEEIDSGLNECLSTEANIDQTGRGFLQDVVMSMFDEGCVAIVPVDTTENPSIGMPGSFDILSMRTGKIIQWYPTDIKLEVYNDRTGKKQQIKVPKRSVAIIENPLFAIINEPNSTMQRLIRKLALLDVVDEESSSGKLDMIIQLPYIIKTEARREQAENRRKQIEDQLKGSKYGIAYADGTEKIVQLNKSLENNLLSQVEYLTKQLFAQLGITEEILNGTADEKVMLNYYNRTIEPIVSAIAGEMKRKFITKTARTQGQSIMFFRDPFRLVPVNDLANIADSFTRNEIMTSNEIRQVIGMKPAPDPRADELINSNNISGRELSEEDNAMGDYTQEELEPEEQEIEETESRRKIQNG